jgi:hypothetical protein
MAPDLYGNHMMLYDFCRDEFGVNPTHLYATQHKLLKKHAAPGSAAFLLGVASSAAATYVSDTPIF